MSETFFASDLHFGHENAVKKFTREDGSPLRGFSSCDEMDETIIENWNKTVNPTDRVFVLGDLVINKKHLHKVARLNGQKTLILGNHDLEPFQAYLEVGISRILALKEFDKCVLTHIPVHTSQIGHGRRWRINVHGHTHNHHVGFEDCTFRNPDYYNVSIDCFSSGDHTGMNYFPKSWDQIKKESGIE